MRLKVTGKTFLVSNKRSAIYMGRFYVRSEFSRKIFPGIRIYLFNRDDFTCHVKSPID